MADIRIINEGLLLSDVSGVVKFLTKNLKHLEDVSIDPCKILLTGVSYEAGSDESKKVVEVTFIDQNTDIMFRIGYLFQMNSFYLKIENLTAGREVKVEIGEVIL